ncbi:hypothetical protein CP336_27740 [Pseudomonas fluorescens]|jgi:hypothetical protein|nr:hypothetical protein CP336_27740 [Pseudomonas fluorescens]
MDFLCFLAFVAAWGFMWRWVVKNRGSWNLFLGNLIGAVGGFIVGVVVLSIFLSLFPSANKSKDKPAPEIAKEAAATKPGLMPEQESAATQAPIAPVPVPAPAPVSDNLASYVASEPQNEPSPPESALMPYYSKRMATSVSEKKIEDTAGKNFVTLRQMMGKDPNADKSVLASVMCTPFIQSAMRFPMAAVITPQEKTSSKRFKDQTYTISNTVTARNMLGDDVRYRFDCSIQQLPANDSGYAEWRLLDLKLQKAGS